MKYASLFTVAYHSTYKVIKYNPTQAKFQSGFPNPSLQNQKVPDLVLYQRLTLLPNKAFDLWFGLLRSHVAVMK